MTPNAKSHPLPLVFRLPLAAALLVALCEGLYRFPDTRWGANRQLLRLVGRMAVPVLSVYLRPRHWVVDRTILSVLATVAVIVGGLLLYRKWLVFWNNHVVARLAGTFFRPVDHRFPQKKFDVFEQIAKRPPGQTFVGMSPTRCWYGWKWEPVYLTEIQRASHRHTLGRTGSGKSQGVLWVEVLHDVLDGKGCVVMSGKGSEEEVAILKAIAQVAKRERDLRVFALPAWNEPSVFTHRYNMLFVDPRTPEGRGGDPILTAERVFSVLPLGDNAYYNTQAQVLFTNLVKLLHCIVDERGYGVPFVMRDLAVCLKGIGDQGLWHSALAYCLRNSKDQAAAKEIESQISRLGRDIQKAISGLVGACDKFLGEPVNAYDPDIVMDEVLEKNLIVYIQLPSNLMKFQAPALGRVFLIDVQQQGSLRQIYRNRNQRAFSVVVDEFARFADTGMVDSLNQLRDAHVQFTLAHQSVADLEMVSREFPMAIWDATRTKDILNQDNPALCDLVAKSIGTYQEVLKTVRQEAGPLFTSLATREASSRQVESYRLHPNAIKNLARFGQGYSFTEEGLKPVCYGMMDPSFRATYELGRKDQTKSRGLRLYDTFIEGRADAVSGENSTPAKPGFRAMNFPRGTPASTQAVDEARQGPRLPTTGPVDDRDWRSAAPAATDATLSGDVGQGKSESCSPRPKDGSRDQAKGYGTLPGQLPLLHGERGPNLEGAPTTANLGSDGAANGLGDSNQETDDASDDE